MLSLLFGFCGENGKPTSPREAKKPCFLRASSIETLPMAPFFEGMIRCSNQNKEPPQKKGVFGYRDGKANTVSLNKIELWLPGSALPFGHWTVATISIQKAAHKRLKRPHEALYRPERSTKPILHSKPETLHHQEPKPQQTLRNVRLATCSARLMNLGACGLV